MLVDANGVPKLYNNMHQFTILASGFAKTNNLPYIAEVKAHWYTGILYSRKGSLIL